MRPVPGGRPRRVRLVAAATCGGASALGAKAAEQEIGRGLEIQGDPLAGQQAPCEESARKGFGSGEGFGVGPGLALENEKAFVGGFRRVALECGE